MYGQNIKNVLVYLTHVVWLGLFFFYINKMCILDLPYQTFSCKTFAPE